MTRTTGNSEFFTLPKAVSEFRLADLEAMAASQRKTVEALTQANQLALEGMRALAHRQTELLQQAFQDASELVRGWDEPNAPEERLAQTTEAAKRAFERSVAHAREVNELSAKASADVFAVFARRISDGFNEVRLYAKKHAPAE